MEDEPLRPLLESTKRPVIIDDIATTPFVNESRRTLLLAAGIHSAIVAPMVWQSTVVGTLSAGGREVSGFGPRDAQFLNAVATQVTAIVRTASLVEELQSASSKLLQAHTETVLMLASAAEAHDHSTGRHLHRVRSITEALALELGHDEETAKEIGLAAVLHDIGKIRVPDYVLTSAESLGDVEWALMKHHTVWGGEFLGRAPGVRAGGGGGALPPRAVGRHGISIGPRRGGDPGGGGDHVGRGQPRCDDERPARIARAGRSRTRSTKCRRGPGASSARASSMRWCGCTNAARCPG